MLVRLFWSGLALFALSWPAGCHAQSPSATTRRTPTFSEISKIQTELTELEAQASLPKKVRSLLEQARQYVAVARDAQASTASFINMRDTASAREKSLTDLFKKVTTQPDVAAGVKQTSALESLLQEARQRLNAIQQRKQELSDLPALRAKRLEAIPKELASLTERLTALRTAPQTTPQAATQPALARAEQLSYEAEGASLETQIAMRHAEAAAYQAASPLQPLELQLADKQAAAEQHRIKILTKRLETSRQRDYETARKQLPTIAPLVAETHQLQTAAQKITQQTQTAVLEANRLKRHVERLNLLLEDVRQRFQLAGQTEQVGRLLREQRRRLPEDATLDEKLQKTQLSLREAKLQALDYQTRRSDTPLAENEVDFIFKNIPSERQTPEMATYIRTEVQNHEAALNQVIQAQQAYASALDEVVVQQRHIVAVVDQIRAFVDENLMWIRNAPPLGPESPESTMRALGWLASPTNWRRAINDLTAGLKARPLISGLLALVVILLLLGRRPMCRRLAAANRLAEENPPGTAHLLLKAMLLTVVLGLIWPIVLWALASRLTVAPDTAMFSRGLARGLAVVAWQLLPILLLWVICCPEGLAQVHLRWEECRLAAARKVLLFMLPLPLLLGLMEMLTAQQRKEDLEVLEQLTVMATMIYAVVLTVMLLRPAGKLVRYSPHDESHGLLLRTRWLWFSALIVLPLMMTVAAGMGFLFAVQQMLRMVISTVWLVIGICVVRDLATRTIFHARRWLVRRHVLKVREESEEEQEAIGESIRDQVNQVSAASDEVSRLVHTILFVVGVIVAWSIWDDLLPTIRGLGRIDLWPGGDGPVSLLSLLAAVAVTVVVTYAVRAVPQMLDVALLVRLRLDAGARYAIDTLMRYSLLIIGVMIVAHCLGITWKSVQFAIAGLGVGLGFGLQEIFANFICGIIILIERPIRVGDVVTIGEVSGTVSKIKIRATTLTDWDCKELVIPNKTFITGQLTNWSLSDKMLRLVIPVGVAYGSDTELTEKTLLELAEANEKVRKDPAPQAFFIGFGDSTLNFELRVFLSGIDDYRLVRHNLHKAIDAAFREKGITIAFPQQDVHLFYENSPIPPTNSPEP